MFAHPLVSRTPSCPWPWSFSSSQRWARLVFDLRLAAEPSNDRGVDAALAKPVDAQVCLRDVGLHLAPERGLEVRSDVAYDYTVGGAPLEVLASLEGLGALDRHERDRLKQIGVHQGYSGTEAPKDRLDGVLELPAAFDDALEVFCGQATLKSAVHRQISDLAGLRLDFVENAINGLCHRRHPISAFERYASSYERCSPYTSAKHGARRGNQAHMSQLVNILHCFIASVKVFCTIFRVDVSPDAECDKGDDEDSD